MNTNHIAILLEVESCRSISKAASNLYMSQPQVSNIIRNLEEENGFPIFVRTRSGVSLTAQGKLFLESLRAIQTEMEKISRIPEHFQEKKDLSIAAIYSRFLFQAFLRFRELFPERGVTDYFMEEMNDSVIDRVVSRQVRIGILSRTPNLPGHLGNLIERYNLDYQVLKDQLPMNVMMRRDHTLASEKQLTLSQIQGYPVVCFQRSDEEFFRDYLHIEREGTELVVSDRASFLEALDSGNYISISSTSSEKVTQGNKYAYVPLSGMSNRSEIAYIKPKTYQLTDREQQFFHFLKTFFTKYYN